MTGKSYTNARQNSSFNLQFFEKQSKHPRYSRDHDLAPNTHTRLILFHQQEVPGKQNNELTLLNLWKTHFCKKFGCVLLFNKFCFILKTKVTVFGYPRLRSRYVHLLISFEMLICFCAEQYWITKRSSLVSYIRTEISFLLFHLLCYLFIIPPLWVQFLNHKYTFF